MIDDNDEDRPFCPSCHKAYSDHDGLIRTCRDLQRAKSNIELLRKALADMIDATDESRPSTKHANLPTQEAATATASIVNRPDSGFPAINCYPMQEPIPMMCERNGCDKQAVYDCEPIPGTAEPGWENEPTARCEEHAKGLLILRRVVDVSKD